MPLLKFNDKDGFALNLLRLQSDLNEGREETRTCNELCTYWESFLLLLLHLLRRVFTRGGHEKEVVVISVQSSRRRRGYAKK